MGRDSLLVIGVRLREAREAAGSSIEQVCEAAQIDLGRLQQLEAGAEVIEAAEVMRLVAHYGITADELFADIEDIQGGTIREEEIGQLVGNMLTNGEAGRGQKFKDLVRAIKDSQRH